ncbi:hypothetical protein ElyMa_002897400 [Elysia marginata]|uniref:Uncharacterized protein n=1 Tax=Elysia marginata TaxID=1093978 RepID=A0AAV4I3W1_9GAST|nr:hypothetical protein ElyMa_002897400 [Elysia marginata]
MPIQKHVVFHPHRCWSYTLWACLLIHLKFFVLPTPPIIFRVLTANHCIYNPPLMSLQLASSEVPLHESTYDSQPASDWTSPTKFSYTGPAQMFIYRWHFNVATKQQLPFSTQENFESQSCSPSSCLEEAAAQRDSDDSKAHRTIKSNKASGWQQGPSSHETQ